jgi:hypothetical protein
VDMYEHVERMIRNGVNLQCIHRVGGYVVLIASMGMVYGIRPENRYDTCNFEIPNSFPDTILPSC